MAFFVSSLLTLLLLFLLVFFLFHRFAFLWSWLAGVQLLLLLQYDSGSPQCFNHNFVLGLRFDRDAPPMSQQNFQNLSSVSFAFCLVLCTSCFPRESFVQTYSQTDYLLLTEYYFRLKLYFTYANFVSETLLYIC